MAVNKKIRAGQGPASEFERKGPFPFGFFGLRSAIERMRFSRRVEQDPESESANLNATPDKWGHGGIDSLDDYKIR